ncbi:MAG: phospholipase A [Granulosicoccus sp.]|nr:phospholipase A [Granulosicoccus sp.]
MTTFLDAVKGGLALLSLCGLISCVTIENTYEPSDAEEQLPAVPVEQEHSVANSDSEAFVIPEEVDDNMVYIPDTESAPGPVTERARAEREVASNPYVITAHKHNYFLPVSFTTRLNEEIYQQNDVRLREGLIPTEVQFQISLKNQLNEKDLLFKDDALSLGITIEAWWQLYSDDLSSPFRETNYQPEVFYTAPLSSRLFGGGIATLFGLEHQSNGQVQGLSRSWNRLYAGLIYEKGSKVVGFRTWYRIPEKAKSSPDEADGDDNPNILDYMGYGELSFSIRDAGLEYAAKVRANPSTGRGAIELGLTYPLFSRFRGFVKYFNGYGESLIEYDHFQQRIGVGVALTSLY